MPSIEMNDAVAAMKKVQKTIGELQEKQADLLGKEKCLADRKSVLLTQPLSPADIKEFLFDLIDARASEYPGLAGLDNLFQSLVYPARGMGDTTEKLPALSLQDIDAVAKGGLKAETDLFGSRGVRLFGTGSNLTSHTDFAAYFFFGDIIKEKIGQQLDAWSPAYREEDRQNIGPAVAKRRQELEQIEVDLKAVRLAKSEIEEQLSMLGVKPESFVERGGRKRQAMILAAVKN